jgi:two-component system KDP operon response regulator KdpE
MTDLGLRILVVDDERAIRRYLRATLTAYGNVVSEAPNGEEALRAAALEKPDLIILDLGLPDLDGVEVARRIREWSQTPIIVLSVREQERDKIAALDAVADDYLTKPFGTGDPESEPVIEVGELKVDLAHRRVTIAEAEATLTPTEYELLRLMAQNIGRVLTHRQLLQQVWGQPYGDDLHMLRVNISNLRRKIEPDPARPHYILTEAGVGYRLRAEG